MELGCDGELPESGEEAVADASCETMIAYAYTREGISATRLDTHVMITYLSYTLDGTAHGEHPLVNSWDDLTNPCLDAGLLSEIGNVFSTLADNDTGILGANKCTQCEHFVVSWGWRAGLVDRS